METTKGKLPTQVMIDCETLGTKPGCVVLSIGITDFDLDMLYRDDSNAQYDLTDIASADAKAVLELLRAQTSYFVLPILPQLAAGLSIDPNTAKWWTSKEGFPGVFLGTDLKKSLVEIVSLLKTEASSTRFWAKSPRFDFNILQHLFQAVGVEWPVPFRNEDDLRCYEHDFPDVALFDMKPLNLQPHNAGDDACAQALAVLRVQQMLRNQGINL